ncbi:MAG: hypothetical protein V4490_06335 [Pseudomonadota bacterium]
MEHVLNTTTTRPYTPASDTGGSEDNFYWLWIAVAVLLCTVGGRMAYTVAAIRKIRERQTLPQYAAQNPTPCMQCALTAAAQAEPLPGYPETATNTLALPTEPPPPYAPYQQGALTAAPINEPPPTEVFNHILPAAEVQQGGYGTFGASCV